MMLAVSVVLVGTSLALPATEKMPVFDVGPSCHAATSLMSLDPERSKRCIEDENSARDQVAKQWAKFPIDDRERCSKVAQLDGSPSYVDLLECLTLAREARSAPD